MKPCEIVVLDDVLPDPAGYRAAALACPFETIQTGDEHWHGIALLEVDQPLTRLIAEVCAPAEPRLTFFRKSPYGQIEPNFVHSDEGMGEWTAILYLNPTPADGDGTDFWRYRETGAVSGSARELPKDVDRWERWRHVDARFNRLLLFDSWYFHSRAIEANYGVGDDARLIQVVFGTMTAPVITPHVREATVADIPRVVEMGQRFLHESKYATRLRENPAQMAALAHRLITTDSGVVFVVEAGRRLVGLICVALFDHHLSGDRTAGEVCFWVEPEHRGHGVRLMRAAERWARERGAGTLQMIAPSEDVGRLYERLGYTALEVAYEKVLTPKEIVTCL